MPWKLITFLSSLIVAALFIGFNLENRCDVSFIFHVFEDVPIFVSLLFSYVAGALTVIPFFLVHQKKRSKKMSGSKFPKTKLPRTYSQTADRAKEYSVD